MLGWTPKELTPNGYAIAANLSAVAVGSTFNLNASGATRALLIGIKCSGIAGVVSAQLQTSVANGETYSNVSGKTATLSSGWNYIKVHHSVTADAALLPLLGVGRLVLTSDGSGAGTISNIQVFQEL
jgi:hypothetical protein